MAIDLTIPTASKPDTSSSAGSSSPSIDLSIPQAVPLPDEPFTAGGVPLTPYTMGDVTTERFSPEMQGEILKGTIARDFTVPELDTTTPGFSARPEFAGDVQPIEIDISEANTADMMGDYDEFVRIEGDRIESVLNEVLGTRYEGREVSGPLTVGDQDGLSRRFQFDQRRAYFKKKYPNGVYFRQPVGGGKFVEMYSLAPDGPLYRVDPDGLNLADIGRFSGNVLNFTTAGGVVGSLFSPLLGTAAGATLGNALDQYITDELSMTQAEALKKIDAGDAAFIGMLDGVLAKVIPGIGGKFKGALLDEPTSILASKTAPEGLAAQEAAERIRSVTGVDLPLLSVAQLSKNPLMRGIASQAGGTSPKIGELLNNQKRKLLEALEVKAQSGYNNFSQAELRMYVDLQARSLAEQVDNILVNRVQNREGVGQSLVDTERAIREATKELGLGLDEAIDTAYKTALFGPGADDVVFDLSGVQSVAQTIKTGTQARTQTKPQATETVETGLFDAKGQPILKEVPTGETKKTARIGGEVSGDLGSVVNDFLNVFNPELSKLVVRDAGRESSFTALQQLKAFRDQVSNIANAGGQDSKAARDLLKEIDNALENPTGGGDAWKVAWNEAKELVRFKSDAMNVSELASFFSRGTEFAPDKLAQKFWTGEFDSRTWNRMEGLIVRSGKTPQGREAGQLLIQEVRNGYLQWLTSNPRTMADRITAIERNDPELFRKLVPKAEDRAALRNVAEEASFLQSDGVNSAISRKMTESERALTTVNSMTEGEIIEFIGKNGGINGPMATDLRAALLKKLIDQSTDPDEFTDASIINPQRMADALDQLKHFRGDYAKYRPLFMDGNKPTQYFKDITDFRLYAGFLSGAPDVGGPFQTGAVRSGLARLELAALRTILTNDILAGVLSNPASVAQLRNIHGKGFGKKYASTMTVLLNNFRRDFVNDETVKEEVQRTGEPPQLGDLPPAVEPAPIPSPPPPIPDSVKIRKSLNQGIRNLDAQIDKNNAFQNKIQGILNTTQAAPTANNFQSLFPRDELGGAIANRRNQGIRSLV